MLRHPNVLSYAKLFDCSLQVFILSDRIEYKQNKSIKIRKLIVCVCFFCSNGVANVIQQKKGNTKGFQNNK